MRIGLLTISLCFASNGLMALTAQAQAVADSPATAYRQLQSDANFTGSLVATSAVAMPPGAINIEPYLFWGDARGSFDQHHNYHKNKRDTRTWSTSLPLYFGVLPDLNVHMILNGSHMTNAQGSSDGFRMGDSKVRLLYQLNHADADTSQPVFAVAVAKSIPSGSYEHLGNRPLNGVGSGSRAWTFGLYNQIYFWMPNGHILRMRTNINWTTDSQRIDVNGVSSYNTPRGFRGWARAGRSGSFDLALEYSMDSHWVLAMDATYNRFSSNRVYRHQPHGGSQLYSNSGGGESLQWAPAIEYNWNGHIGLIAGVQMTPWGRNTDRVVTPQMALNIYY